MKQRLIANCRSDASSRYDPAGLDFRGCIAERARLLQGAGCHLQERLPAVKQRLIANCSSDATVAIKRYQLSVSYKFQATSQWSEISATAIQSCLTSIKGDPPSTEN